MLSIAKVAVEEAVTIFLRFVRCKIMLHSCLTFQHCSHAFRPLHQAEHGSTEPTLLKAYCVRVSVDERVPTAVEVTQHVRQRLCNNTQKAGRREVIRKSQIRAALLGAPKGLHREQETSVFCGERSEVLS